MAVMMRSMLEVADNSGARKLQMICRWAARPDWWRDWATW